MHRPAVAADHARQRDHVGVLRGRSTVTLRCVSDEPQPAAARSDVSTSDSSAALDHVSPGLSEKRSRTS